MSLPWLLNSNVYLAALRRHYPASHCQDSLALAQWLHSQINYLYHCLTGQLVLQSKINRYHLMVRAVADLSVTPGRRDCLFNLPHLSTKLLPTARIQHPLDHRGSFSAGSAHLAVCSARATRTVDIMKMQLRTLMSKTKVCRKLSPGKHRVCILSLHPCYHIVLS